MLGGRKRKGEGGTKVFKAPDVGRRTTVYPKVSGLAAWSENCK
jgi:hypothetical protein